MHVIAGGKDAGEPRNEPLDRVMRDLEEAMALVRALRNLVDTGIKDHGSDEWADGLTLADMALEKVSRAHNTADELLVNQAS